MDSSILDTAKSTDRSIGFINDIFGSGWENALTGGTPAGEFGNVLIEMFYSFNAIVLAGVAVLLFYVISAGVVGTAHEGEALGKRYSTLWTPIRSALAISFLMPLPWVKLSLLQALVLKFIFFSISGASYLASQTVDMMAKQGGAMTLAAAPTIQGEGIAAEILKNLTVQEYFSQQEQVGFPGDGFVETSGGSDNESLTKSIIFSAPNYGVPGVINRSDMGSISVSCTQNQQSVCDSEIALVRQLITTLRPLAREFGMAQDGENSSIGSLSIYYNQAIKAYATQSQIAATNALGLISDQKQVQLSKFTNAISNNGWTWLGAYYSAMLQQNAAAHAATESRASVAKPMRLDLAGKNAGKEFEASITQLKTFLDTEQAGLESQIASAGQPNDEMGIGRLASSFFADALMSSFCEASSQQGAGDIVAGVLSTGDPVLNLQELGHKLINTSSVLLTGMGGAMIAKSAVDIFPSGRLAGMAASILGADDAMGKLIGMAMALLVPVVLALMFAGICFAYYVPALPFIIWVSAIVGWLVLTMEMMVAAPIWAAMHAIPEGEGMAGQHGKQGYMMFFGILFRPALHVIGFFMAFAIVNTVGHFIGNTYQTFTAVTNGDAAPYGLPAQAISWLATLVIGASIAVVSIHKVFNLITWLPDNILRWAGGNTPSLGHDDKSGGMIVAAMSQTQHKISGGLSKAVDGFSKPSSSTGTASSKAESKADMHTLGDI